MNMFIRGTLAVGALALPFALAGCGERQAGTDAARPGPDSTSVVTSYPSGYSYETPDGEASAGGTPSSSYSPRPETALPDVPPDHVDNQRFRKTAPLSPEAKAAGERTAERVKAAFQPLVGQTPYRQEQFRERLVGAGFADAALAVGPEAVTFSGTLPTGGCLTGSIHAGVLATEVHGFYIEGGCERPKGGH